MISAPAEIEVIVAVVFRFASSHDVLSCRWAVSPLRETLGAVRMLGRPHRQGYHLPWLRSVESTVERLDLTVLPALLGRHYTPDFLCPPPNGPRPSFEEELARVRSTEPERVAAELARAPSTGLPVSAGPAERRDLLADAVEDVWRRLLAPWWPRISEVLENDIAHWTRVLADEGLGAVLADLHPKVSWSRDAVTVALPVDADREIDATGLLLMPSVFEWPDVGVAFDPPWTPTIDYSARGIAALWQSTATPSEALGRLVGRTRALLLTALVEPTSTTGLARRCAVPVSTVSEQLRILRDAGLLHTHRAGRFLRHERTPLGTALVDGT
jgi:DNA-binding transcriptional ArsR family regulator